MPIDPVRASAPIYLADLDRCQPSSAVGRKGTLFSWRLIDYEADGFNGVSLRAGAETAAAEAAYPLQVEGWHDIYFGLFNTAWRPYLGQRIWIRLDTDPAFSLLYLPPPEVDPGQVAQDVFWKTADLSGRRISFKQLCREQVPRGETSRSTCENAWIIYIKLVPLTEEEVGALETDRMRTDTRCLVATQDGGTGMLPDSDPDSVRDLVEGYRNTDFGRIYWEAACGDLCNYYTKLGRIETTEHIELDDYPLFEYRRKVENWTEYAQQGTDPLQIAVDHAHKLGMEFYASYRFAEGMGPFHFSPPFEEVNQGGFLERHPELRATRRDGSPTPRISLSYPEARQYLVSLFREMANYPVDGICPLFNRRPPYVEYEPPLLESFQQEYGQDPRQLDEKDPRWLRHRAQLMTDFIRDLRKMLDEVAREQGRSKKLSVWVFGSQDENLYWGLDVETWIKESLIDTVVPYTSAEGLYSWELAWEDPSDVEYWLSLTRDTKCQLSLDIMPRHLTPEQYHRKAHQLFSLGVESLTFWDSAKIWGPEFDVHSSFHHGYGTELQYLKRLGHREELKAWVEAGEPRLSPSTTQLKKMGDWEMTFITE